MIYKGIQWKGISAENTGFLLHTFTSNTKHLLYSIEKHFHLDKEQVLFCVTMCL